MTRRLLTFAAVATLCLAPGCGPRAKEITSLQRKEAAALVSEAQFAITLRDYARAEDLLAKAVVFCPDTADYWLSLGSMRMRLGQRDGAKTAYKRALTAFEDAARRDAKDTQAVIQQVYVLALLGRVDDARALFAKLPDKFPGNANVRALVDRKQVEQMLAGPKFKENAL